MVLRPLSKGWTLLIILLSLIYCWWANRGCSLLKLGQFSHNCENWDCYLHKQRWSNVVVHNSCCCCCIQTYVFCCCVIHTMGVFLCCTQCCTMVFLWSCTKTVRNRKPCHCTSGLAGQPNTLRAQFSRNFFERKIEKRRTSAVQFWQKGTMYLRSMYLIQPYNSECPMSKKWDTNSEMQKAVDWIRQCHHLSSYLQIRRETVTLSRLDMADISVLFFQGSANFWAVHANRNRNCEHCAVWTALTGVCCQDCAISAVVIAQCW